ncbi:unnamed protein product [Ascophyllum nodosum]
MSRTAFVAAVVTVLIARPTAIRGVAAAFSPVTVPPNSSMNLCHSRCRSHGPRRGHSSDSLHPFFSRNVYLFRWLKLSFLPSAQALLSSRGGGGGNMGDDGRRDEGGESCGSEPRGFEDPAFRKGNDPLVLEGVKNIRDLGSIAGSGIQRGRVFRTGHLSDATESDAAALRDVTGLRTMVDLRSATELGKDCSIDGYVYNGFVNIGDGGAVWDGSTPSDEAAVGGRRDCGDGRREETKGSNTHCGRRRYFVSLIDEDVYKKGVFQRLRRRHKAVVMALAPAALVSRRVTKKARGIFLREINAGGLILLNELLLQYSGKGISHVLRLLATRERHPIALYCTAGKDRTGLIIALVLATLGVPDEAIVDDYARSESAYKELGDQDAMVGALAQEDLDPDIFLGAPRYVMEHILRFIRERYGSVEGYLDSIGFDAGWRQRLRDALLVE